MAWQSAPLTTDLLTTVPEEGGQPSAKTEVRVLANERCVVFGIRCHDTDPAGIVRFSKLRGTDLENEDHIRIVIDPFLDGQSGYVFSVNANGARYDALVPNRVYMNWKGRSIGILAASLLNFELAYVRSIGYLPRGDFDQTLAGLRVRLNVTPDLQLNSFLQYDTESRLLGRNARVHWIFNPLGDAFLVFNYNSFDDKTEGWSLQNQQVVLKVRYNLRG